MKDNCVLCGEQTIYDFDDHIDARYGYVEGVGQLCMTCYGHKDKKQDVICIPVQEIKTTPNDMELGEKIRNIYYGQQQS